MSAQGWITNCTIAWLGLACSPRASQVPVLAPAPTAADLYLSAWALQDTTLGPFFPPGRLVEGVWLIREIRRRYPATREVVLSGEPGSFQFRASDSLAESLCDRALANPPPFVDRWLNPPRVGVAPFDSITDALGGASGMHIQGAPPQFCLVTVYYREPVNIPGLAQAYAPAQSLLRKSPLQGIEFGDGDGIHVEVTDSIWTVHMSAGWGDCPAGCINRHRWTFRYHRASLGIEVVTDSGPPLPRPRDPN